MLKFKVIHKKDFSFHCYTTTINHRFTTTYHNGIAAAAVVAQNSKRVLKLRKPPH